MLGWVRWTRVGWNCRPFGAPDDLFGVCSQPFGLGWVNGWAFSPQDLVEPCGAVHEGYERGERPMKDTGRLALFRYDWAS